MPVFSVEYEILKDILLIAVCLVSITIPGTGQALKKLLNEQMKELHYIQRKIVFQ